MFDGIKAKLSANPEVYEQPVRSMVKAYNNIKSDNNLVSALRMFGRYTGVSLAKRKVGSKVSAVSFPARSTGSIAVQPTSIAQRRKGLGGRRCLVSGHPTKEARVVDHGYA